MQPDLPASQHAPGLIRPKGSFRPRPMVRDDMHLRSERLEAVNHLPDALVESAIPWRDPLMDLDENLAALQWSFKFHVERRWRATSCLGEPQSRLTRYREDLFVDIRRLRLGIWPRIGMSCSSGADEFAGSITNERTEAYLLSHLANTLF